MERFIELTAIAAPMLEINIDTDIIIPSREMKRVSKQGLGEGLFAGEHYPVAERLARQGLYLPSGLALTGAQLEQVCAAVRKVLL